MKGILRIFINTGIIVSLFSACGNLVEGLNEDPNNPTSSPYNFVLTGSQVGTVIVHAGETSRKANIFSGHLEGIDRQHQTFNNYIVSSGDFDGKWDDMYVHAIRNAVVAEGLAIEQGRAGVATGIAKVMQALAFGTATSLWGDIPFEEAGIIEILNPSFEPQQQVYDKLQLLLDAAIIELGSGQGRVLDNTDIYFNGEHNAWVQVAHTLKARYYMHTKNYGAAYQAATNGISTQNNSMRVPHVQAQTGSNLYYQFFAVARPNDIRVSDFFQGMLNSTSGSYRGNAKTNETARFNNYFRTASTGITVNTNAGGYMAATAKFPLVTHAENLLILAEAGLRSNDFNTGLTHLNEFRAFMRNGGYLNNVAPTNPGLQFDDYVAADFQAGGMANPGGLSQNDALLKEILEERYITLFGQIEGFADVRRTQDEQNVRVEVTPNVGNELPQRFLYAQTEIDRNSKTPSPIPDFFVRTPVNQ